MKATIKLQIGVWHTYPMVVVSRVHVQIDWQPTLL